MKHFIDISDCTSEELRHLLDVSLKLKKQYRETGRERSRS